MVVITKDFFKKYRWLLVMVFYLFLFLYPSIASAHAYIIKSTPSENEILDESPGKVSIEFDETIQPNFNSIEVFDSAGKRVDQKHGRIDAKNHAIIESSLKKSLPDGTYSIRWRVVSSDGHPVQGTIPFQIGNETENNSGINQESTGYTPGWDLIIIRWLQYSSNACYIGTLFFYLLVLPKAFLEIAVVRRRCSQLLTVSFIALTLSILLSLPLQASIESGLPWNSVLNLDVLMDMVANTRFGKTWLIQIDGLVVLCLLTFFLQKNGMNKRLWVWLSFILGMGLAGSRAFTSHAASTTNVSLSIPLDVLHLLSAFIWIGSLIALAALIPFSRKAETKELYLESIRRFAKWGMLLVIVLALTGFAASFSYIPNPRTLLVTDYGRVLTGKVFLLVIMVLFAASNFVKGKQRRKEGLSASLWGELTAGLMVFILSVLLTNLPTAMVSPGPFKETNKVGTTSTITLEVTPNVFGENTLELSLKDQSGRPIKRIEQVTLTFTSLEMEMGKDTAILKKVKDGIYRSKGMNFNMAGRWNVHVHVLTAELEALDTDFKVRVGSQ